MTGTPAPGAPEPPPGRRRRRGARPWAYGAALAAVAAIAGAAAGLPVLRGGPPGATAASTAPPATATVTRRTLSDTTTADGVLGHGPATTATSRLPGTLTHLPGTGAEITRGRALYSVDGDPVTLMYGSTPAYRTLAPGAEGADVRQLERNLRALGYDGFTVDGEYTYGTATAVREWQADRKMAETGTVPLGRVVFASGPVRIDALHAEEGGPTAPGQRVLSYTGVTTAVTVDLEVSDARLAARGAAVTVTLPDGKEVAGRVTESATVIEQAQGEQEPATKVEVTVGFPGRAARRAAGAYALAAVDVTFTAGRREGVLAVPVAALLALREGGFGVEVVQGGTSRYVPVRTGLFADGLVEISGAGIAEGTAVGVPA
ncbi:peptidoglycan-binding protein [Sphaerisporangium rufum]|uniref:Peptidoglycan-binding protein n=1 Tax=Sphaerisporangium rufum TaxID=1381558 RepID=A0A919R926_9ACTN|nr:peptidoglycan-binding protein [Sphaerisporangium rufum]GII81458.1 peptidoglycan-binding protein [Sphaerisporangium rufum]